MKTNFTNIFPRCTLLLVLLCISGSLFAEGNPGIGPNRRKVSRLQPQPAMTILLSPGTVQWTGAVSTDWNTPGNWTATGGSPNIPPASGSGGDDVVIPDVSGGSGNFPVVGPYAAGARSIVIQPGAKLTVIVGGSLTVLGSALDGVTNSGMLTNNGTMLVDSSFANGIINNAAAVVTNTGSLTVREGTGSRMINSGTVNNNGGTCSIGGGLGVGLVNQGTGVINNAATFQVQYGKAGIVDNFGVINNTAGSFSLSGGDASIVGWYVLRNRPGAKIYNAAGAGISVASGGKYLYSVRNDGLLSNTGTCNLFGSDFGIFLNNDTLINQATGSFNISSGKSPAVENVRYFQNKGRFTIFDGGAGSIAASFFNSAGAMAVNDSILTINGVSGTHFDNAGMFINNRIALFMNGSAMNLYNRATGQVLNNDSLFLQANGFPNPNSFPSLRNEGNFTLSASGKMAITNVGGNAILNSGVILSTNGCRLRAASASTDIVNNQAGATFCNECVTSFTNTNGAAILNNGVYKHTKGSLNLGASTTGITNNRYFLLDVPVQQFIGGIGGNVFANTDTMLLGPSCNINMAFITAMIDNAGFFRNQSDIRVQNMGGSFVLNRAGAKFIHEAGRTLSGQNLSFSGPPFSNAGQFFNYGTISTRLFSQPVLSNSGRFVNAGTIRSSNFAFFTDGLINADTLINTGTIDLDTIYGNGIVNNKYFLNDTTGKIYLDYIRTNAINNNLSFVNNGELYIARDTGVGGHGISNAATGAFTNAGFLDIGRKGPVFGEGINNSGSFLHRTNALINMARIDSVAIINNAGASFLSQPCSRINTEQGVVDSGTFINGGILYKMADTFDVVSYIAVNKGMVINEDVDAFNIGMSMGGLYYTSPPAPAALASYQKPVINAVPVPLGPVCSNVNFNVNMNADSVVTFFWTWTGAGLNGGGAFASNPGSSAPPATSAVATGYFGNASLVQRTANVKVYAKSLTGCRSDTTAFNMVVNPGPKIQPFSPAMYSVCNGSTMTTLVPKLDSTAIYTGVARTWTRDNLANVPGAVPASGPNNVGGVLNLAAGVTSSQTTTFKFAAKVVATGCLSDTVAVPVTVLWSPAVQVVSPVSKTQTKASGALIDSIIVTTVPLTPTAQITWTISGTPIGGTALSDNALPINGSIINYNSMASTTARWVFRARTGGCNGKADTAYVNVLPGPVVPGSEAGALNYLEPLVDFTGSRSGEKSELRLKTVNALELGDYLIERSADGLRFDPFAVVPVTEAEAIRDGYVLYDEHPLPGLNHYRLSLLNSNPAAYGKTVSLLFGRDGAVEAWPNPTRAELNVRIQSTQNASSHLRVYDSRMQAVFVRSLELNPGENALALDLTTLPAGLYFLSVDGITKDKATVLPFVKMKD